MLASELAKLIDGDLVGPGDPDLRGIRPLGEAGANDLAVLHNIRYKAKLAESGAGCIVMQKDVLPENRTFTAILHDNPHQAMAMAVEILYPLQRPTPGIHETAVVDETARIGKDVFIGANAVIGADCVIDDDTIIESGCSIMSDVQLDSNCHIYPNVTIYSKTQVGDKCIVQAGSVLGSDGFGFAPSDEGILKIRQVGCLIIEEDVEIGACCTIDRGTFTETRIGRGTKLDNMVHVAHNCIIGEYCLIAAQTGIAGSTIIGNRVIIAGQVGFAGHQKIGDGCIIFAKSGVNGDIEPGTQLFGYPAKPRMQTHRENAYISKLEGLFKEVKELKKKLTNLEETKEKREK